MVSFVIDGTIQGLFSKPLDLHRRTGFWPVWFGKLNGNLPAISKGVNNQGG
jgi:hypothetical protein